MKDINVVLRNIKIHLITEEYNEFIEWFNNIWNKLIIVDLDLEYINRERIFYISHTNNNEWVFWYDKKRFNILCNASFLRRSTFFMRNDIFIGNFTTQEIQMILKLLLESKSTFGKNIKCCYLCDGYDKLDNNLNI